MAELSTPSLFESSAEKRSEKLAKDFQPLVLQLRRVEFRNSPDVINLRTWAQKMDLKLEGV